MLNNASGTSAAAAAAFIQRSASARVHVRALTCGRMTLSMFFRAVSGDGGEQSGVEPVVQSP